MRKALDFQRYLVTGALSAFLPTKNFSFLVVKKKLIFLRVNLGPPSFGIMCVQLIDLPSMMSWRTPFFFSICYTRYIYII